jgi:uncharacterized membrane protein
MKSIFSGIALACLLALPVQAACYADYKAKRDGPLQLHYGVIKLSDRACTSPDTAPKEIRSKLRSEGWKLLTVISTFGDGGLEKRRSDAGQYFLRY